MTTTPVIISTDWGIGLGFKSRLQHVAVKRGIEKARGGSDIHILPVFGHKRLDEIHKKDVKKFLTDKQKEQGKKKLSSNTVNNQKAYLSCILGQAFDDEIIKSNPASKTGKFIKKTDRKKDINPYKKILHPDAPYNKKRFKQFA